MAKEKLNLNLPSSDDLFSTQQERNEVATEQVSNLKISLIDDFKDHPFKVRIDKDMEDLAESIQRYGVLMPAIVRPKEDGRYEMVSGHRRKFASGMANKEELSCIVRNMTDDEAAIILV